MRLLLAALFWTTVIPLAAHAQPSDGEMILKPQWLRPDFSPQAFYPPRAQVLGQTGAAKIRCDVAQTDTLVNCQVLSEAPAGFGFGEALVKLSSHLHISHLDGDGRPVEGRPVEVKMSFKLH